MVSIRNSYFIYLRRMQFEYETKSKAGQDTDHSLLVDHESILGRLSAHGEK
jgi:hypothetical protein